MKASVFGICGNRVESDDVSAVLADQTRSQTKEPSTGHESRIIQSGSTGHPSTWKSRCIGESSPPTRRESTVAGSGRRTSPHPYAVRDSESHNDRAVDETLAQAETSKADAESAPSAYRFAASDYEDDEDLERQIDIDLDQLSESVARLRRLALAMGRELEMQNQQLARLWTKTEAIAGGQSVGGLWQRGSLDRRK